MNDQDDGDKPAAGTNGDTLPPAPPQTAEPESKMSGNTKDHSSENVQATKNDIHWLEGLSLASNAVLALIGIGALCVYSGQLNVMRGTLEEMKRSGSTATDQTWRAIDNINWLARTMNESLRQTRDAMAAQDRQNKAIIAASRETSRNDQRAWISSGQSALQIDEKGNLELKILLTNSGKTPALDVEAAIGFELTRPMNPTAPGNQEYVFVGFGSYAPQSTLPQNIKANISPYQVDIASGARWVIFHGAIRYRDIYGGETHRTDWCVVYSAGEKEMRACMKGNEMN